MVSKAAEARHYAKLREGPMREPEPPFLAPWAALWVALGLVLAVHQVAGFGSSAPRASVSCGMPAC